MRSQNGKFLDKWKRRESLLNDGHEEQHPDAFQGTAARVVAEFSAKALRTNYEAIRAQVPGQALMPMLKANAYGHGMIWAARQLLDCPDLYGFGVATLSEGAQLREELGASGRTIRVFVFSGACPWTEQRGEYCEKYRLTPVIASLEDWSAFLKGRWQERVTYELKFNTGMNRLGIHFSQLSRVAKDLKALSGEHHPSGILSHLAIGENPDAPLSRSQREKFVQMKKELAGVVPAAHFHLANSAAIWNQKNWGLDGLTDLVRPGISLYGVAPWSGAPARGITPVMTFRASVLAVHRLKPGESTGYGARFKATGTRPVPIAVLGAGYADGLSRRMSGSETVSGGHLWLGGREERLLGVVSMDLSTASCTPDTKVGDWAEILGPNVDIWAQCKMAGTLPYELLTSVSGRVQRIYG